MKIHAKPLLVKRETDRIMSTMPRRTEGNIGYLNEFPPAGPGNGFQFNPVSSGGQRLFEGAIMIATDQC